MGVCESKSGVDNINDDVQEFQDARDAQYEARGHMLEDYEQMCNMHFVPSTVEMRTEGKKILPVDVAAFNLLVDDEFYGDIHRTITAIKKEHEDKAALKAASSTASVDLKAKLHEMELELTKCQGLKKKMQENVEKAQEAGERLKKAIAATSAKDADAKAEAEKEEKMKRVELKSANASAESARRAFEANNWTKVKKGHLKDALTGFYTDWQAHKEQEAKLATEVLAAIAKIDPAKFEVSEIPSVMVHVDELGEEPAASEAATAPEDN